MFTLDNGQVWRQIDGDATQVRDTVTPTKKLSVTIEKSFLGSFILKINNRNGFIKVRRLK